jgi:hypothetical protein
MTNRISDDVLPLHAADPEPQPSAAQRQWQAIAQTMRLTFARIVLDKMAAMDAQAVLAMSQAATNLYWLEHNAALFDKRLDLENMRVFPE